MYDCIKTAGVTDKVTLRFNDYYHGTGTTQNNAAYAPQSEINYDIKMALTAVMEDNPMIFWPDGFTYNYPYYPQHMKELGYKKEVDWIQIHIDIPSKTPYSYAKVAHICKETFNLKAIKINNADIAHRGYSSKIFHFLKQTYFPLFGFTKFSDKQIDDLVKKYLGLIDMRLVSVVENEKNEVIGIAISMYSLSHAIQRSKGKLYPFGWYHLIKALKWRPENHVDLLFIAVRPDYQMLGVNAILFDDLISSYNQLGILWAETAPLQENSIQELDKWKLLNPTFTKRRRCYIKKI